MMSCEVMYQHLPQYFCPGLNQGAAAGPVYPEANRCQIGPAKALACGRSGESRLPYVPMYSAFPAEARTFLEPFKPELDFAKGGSQQPQPQPQPPQQQQQPSSCKFGAPSEGAAAGPKAPAADDDREASPRVHYVSANCVVLTYYTGDIQTVVEEHFRKALSAPGSKKAPPAAGAGGKYPEKGSCLSQRNFPPSFWNSNYAPGGVGGVGGGGGGIPPSAAAGYDPAAYGINDAFNGFYPSEWHYPFHEFPYPGSLTSQYNSLFLPSGSRPTAVRFAHSAQSKSWSGLSRHGGDIYENPYHHFSHHHYTSTVPGLECSITNQDSSKDLYWV